jgi:hypothetical protein
MSEKKPTPILRDVGGVECPICKNRTYSRGGIHPQCAMVQADEPRRLKLAAEKREIAENKQAMIAKPLNPTRSRPR